MKWLFQTLFIAVLAAGCVSPTSQQIPGPTSQSTLEISPNAPLFTQPESSRTPADSPISPRPPGQVLPDNFTLDDPVVQSILKEYLVQNIGLASFGGKVFCAYEPLAGPQKDRDGSQAHIYLWALCQEYYRTAQGLQEGTGSSLPVAIELIKAPGGYYINSYKVPGDGSLFPQDVRAGFPPSTWKEIMPASQVDIEAYNSRAAQLEAETKAEAEMELPSSSPVGKGTDQAVDCSQVERLAADSPDAQQILDEFVAGYKEQYPTEYMGIAILHRVDRLGEWAVVQGSVSGEAKDVIVVRQTPQGYRLAERYIITAPLESFGEPEKLVPEYFLERLPEAPQALFTCLDQDWLLGRAPEIEVSGVFQLAYLSTDEFTTGGVTEIHSLQSDGSNYTVLLHEAMLVMGLVSSPEGERIAFWGCPGSLASDCSAGEDLDVWVVNWDGSNLRNLTEDSSANESHPDWSPDGEQIVFDSDRSGDPQIYIMNSDGGSPRALTDGIGQNSEPKWSPDGKWIAYHYSQEGETRICVIAMHGTSPDGGPAGEQISGTTPVWSPANMEGGMRIAFLCFEAGHSDICTARPDGSDLANLTNSPADEHSPAWSPDGNWLAFVSNRGDDVDVYKVCVNCPGVPATVRLTDEPRAAGWPAWSPDGGQVAYVSGEDLMLVGADRSYVTYLASGVFGPPIWRP